MEATILRGAVRSIHRSVHDLERNFVKCGGSVDRVGEGCCGAKTQAIGVAHRRIETEARFDLRVPKRPDVGRQEVLPHASYCPVGESFQNGLLLAQPY